MCKKILFVTLTWFVVAVVVFVLYLLRDVSPVKEFITWALTVWPILATLGGIAILISGWVIKHDFGTKALKEERGGSPEVVRVAQELKIGDLLLEGEGILKRIDELKAEEAIALADNWINRTQEYLKKEIYSQASYFLSDVGLERVTHLKPKMRNRLIRLKDIFERL